MTTTVYGVTGGSSTPVSRNPGGSSSMTVGNYGGSPGDHQLLFISRADTAAASDVGVPGGLSGWTSLFDSPAGPFRFGVWWRNYSVSDATLTSLYSTSYCQSIMMTVRGGDMAAATVSSEATGTNTTVAGGSLTATDGSLLLSCLAAYDEYTGSAPTVTRPSGMTSRVSGSVTDGVDLGGGAYTFAQMYVDSEARSPGSTGTRSWTVDDPLYDLAVMKVRNIIIPPPSTGAKIGWGVIL